MKILMRFLPLLAAIILPLGNAFATVVVIDQQNTSNGSSINVDSAGTGVGQSFTPNLPAIDAIDILLATNIDTSFETLQVDLFSGAGYGGTLLGSTNPISLGGGISFSTIHFLFPSLITLEPQNIYTFRITLDFTAGAGGYIVENSLSNPYLGGSEYGTNGSSNSGIDLVFKEGLSVPEPSTAFLGLWGVCALMLMLCRDSHNRKRA